MSKSLGGNEAITDVRLIQLWETNGAKQARARRKREQKKERKVRGKVDRKRLWGWSAREKREQEDKANRNTVKVGAWNVRMSGARSRETNQYWKWRCLRAARTKRKRKVALLSDVLRKDRRVVKLVGGKEGGHWYTTTGWQWRCVQSGQTDGGEEAAR